MTDTCWEYRHGKDLKVGDVIAPWGNPHDGGRTALITALDPYPHAARVGLDPDTTQIATLQATGPKPFMGSGITLCAWDSVTTLKAGYDVWALPKVPA